MAKENEGREITLTPNLANIVAGNIGATLSVSSLVSASSGRIRWFDGCITRLFYLNDGKDLDFIVISGAHPGSVNATNLKDFRERLEEAACCGHRVAFCVLDDNTINMLHVYPCQCTCKGTDGHHG